MLQDDKGASVPTNDTTRQYTAGRALTCRQEQHLSGTPQAVKMKIVFFVLDDLVLLFYSYLNWNTSLKVPSTASKELVVKYQ